MKKIIISIIVVLTTMTLLAQSQVENNAGTANDNTQNKQNYESVVYRLFPTQNIWTFLKLNTRNGKLWQVQWSTEANKRFETNLSLIPLVDTQEEVNE